MTIWIDLEDLFYYTLRNPRPSGIQRVCFEICRILGDEGSVRFCRHDVFGRTMRVVGWDEVEALFARFAQQHPEPGAAGSPMGTPPRRERGPLRQFAARLPGEIRQPLAEAVHGQIGVLQALRRGAAGLGPAIARMRQASSDGGGPAAGTRAGQDLREAAARGDILLVMGAPWSHPGYADLVAGLKRDCGIRFALLVYDLIPLLHPEWCAKDLVHLFGTWARTTIPLADTLMAISHATAADVEGWAEREGVRIAGPVRVLPMGTGFSAPPSDAEGRTERVRAASKSPYVLFVSTVEARKNHLLAFRAWRELLRELPRERVPRLVFAGRVGWLVSDLMQQLENADWLEGHVEMVRDPTDAELAALYRGCRFTLFPSLYEGWGLPVSESLSFGKVCVASGKTSVPEAGGAYCLYHDPDSVTEAVALLRRVIEQPELIAEREAALRRDFRPVPWSDAARTILDVVGPHAATEMGA